MTHRNHTRRSEMPMFKKKPVVIDAVLYTGQNVVVINNFVNGARGLLVDGDQICIATLEGVMRASPGDWIIKGVKGEFYPCKPDIFDATYEPA
jgi:hypothetical protein